MFLVELFLLFSPTTTTLAAAAAAVARGGGAGGGGRGGGGGGGAFEQFSFALSGGENALLVRFNDVDHVGIVKRVAADDDWPVGKRERHSICVHLRDRSTFEGYEYIRYEYIRYE